MIAENVAPTRSAQELLEEFCKTGQQAPFEEIVRRYAGMVFNVCFQITKNKHDAEDATQATFLTLAVQCKTNREIKCIGPWLQQVAYRVSLDIRKSAKRRVVREEAHGKDHCTRTVPDGAYELDVQEMRHLVTEELDKLPPKYRLPLILHYFGGLSREEMARELNCKPSTLGVRLFRGREMLGNRLAERGVSLAGGMLAVALTHAVQCQVRDSLVLSTCHAAVALASGQDLAVGVISSHVMTLARGAAKALVFAKYKTVIATLLLAGSALAAGRQVVATVRPGSLRLEIPQIIKDRFTAPLRNPLPSLHSQADSKEQPVPIPQILPAIALDNPPAMPMAGIRSTMPPLLPEAIGAAPMGLMGNGLPRPALSPLPASADWPSVLGGGYANPALAPAYVPADHGPRPGSEFSQLASSATGSSGRPSSDSPHNPPASPGSTNNPLRPPANGGATSTFATNSLPDIVLQPVARGHSEAVSDIRATPVAAVATFIAAADTELWRYAGNSSNSFVLPAGQVGTVQAATWTASDQVLRGHGSVQIASLDNNGQVIADGGGQDRTLDLSSVRLIRNSVDNPTVGANGWYARNGGKLCLPTVPHNGSISWGEDPVDPRIDLVNSVRMDFAGGKVPPGLKVSLLSPDRFDVPPLTNGDIFLDVWSMEPPLANDETHFAIRYDEEAALALGHDESRLHFWRFDGQWRPINGASFHIDPENNLIYGSADTLSYFAVSTSPATFGTPASFSAVIAPEPGAALALGAALLLLARRPRRSNAGK